MMITPIVIQTQRPCGLKVTYIEKEHNFYEKTIRERQHKCRIKEVIYGGCFGYYAEGMDFTNAINAGSKIVIDNR